MSSTTMRLKKVLMGTSSNTKRLKKSKSPKKEKRNLSGNESPDKTIKRDKLD